MSIGGLVRPDGFVANNWFVGTSPLGATEEALVIANFVNAEANVAVRVLGDDGFAAVPGLDGSASLRAGWRRST